MTENLPPLKAIRTFEVAGRYDNFTKAAEELCITPGAVSKQVKLLEDHLGIMLFKRSGPQITLTLAGSRYLALIQEALNIIAFATEQCAEVTAKKTVLHINTLSSSSLWLIPALDDFRQRYPHIKIHISLGHGEVDFSHSETDIAIRVSTKPSWHPHNVKVFMKETVIPVCAPSLKTKDLEEPGDLLRCALLGHQVRPHMWKEFMEEAGYPDAQINCLLSFEYFFMLIPAAENGLGIALLPEFLIKKELAAGTLVPTIPFRFQSPYHYYIISPTPKASLQKVRLFSKWLEEYAPRF